MRRLTQQLLRHYHFATSARHTRSLANRGPCFVAPREIVEDFRVRRGLALTAIRFRDRWEDVFRSFAQLVYGTIMLIDARRLGLCTNHFEAADGVRCPAAGSSLEGQRRPAQSTLPVHNSNHSGSQS